MSTPAYTPLPTNGGNPFPKSNGNPFSDTFPIPNGKSPANVGLDFITKFRQQHLSTLRPLPEFLDLKRFSKPANLGQLTARLNYNLPYFKANYGFMFLGITAYSLITNVKLMCSMGIMYAGVHYISKVPPEGAVIGDTTYTPRQLQTGASAVSILGHAAYMEEGSVSDNN
ncbi:hypothetical protein BGZ94_002084, partial [Podila epigama]